MIELLATIGILMAVVATMLVLGDRSVAQTTLFFSKTQATFLSKEGMEIAKYFKDNLRSEIEEDEGWDGTGIWTVDYRGVIQRENSKEVCKGKGIRIHGPEEEEHKGFYGYGEGEFTPFSRCVTVRAEDENDNLKVTAETFFDYRGDEYSVKIHRIFYD